MPIMTTSECHAFEFVLAQVPQIPQKSTAPRNTLAAPEALSALSPLSRTAKATSHFMYDNTQV